MGDLSNLDVSWRTLLLFGCWFPTLLIALSLVMRELEASASRYLAAFLTLFTLGITPQIIGFSGFYQVWPGLTFAPFNTDLWLGPLLLLHLRRLCLPDTKLNEKIKDTWLLLPGAIQTSYYSFCFAFLGDYKAKFAFNDAFHEPYVVPIETLLVLIITIFCLWQCFQLARHYKIFLNDTQSQADSFVPVWLHGLFYTIVALALTWFVLEILSLLIADFNYTQQYPFYLIMSVMALWSGLKALTDIRSSYPKIYQIMPNAQVSDEELTPDILTTSKEKVKALQDSMERHQWYLQQDLNLGKLARYLGTNQTYLSKTINEGFALNFNQFINQFRVQYAQAALINNPDKDLLSIAFDSGFNSKASFNRIFKSVTQMTPGQYRTSNQTQGSNL